MELLVTWVMLASMYSTEPHFSHYSRNTHSGLIGLTFSLGFVLLIFLSSLFCESSVKNHPYGMVDVF